MARVTLAIVLDHGLNTVSAYPLNASSTRTGAQSPRELPVPSPGLTLLW